MNFSDNDILKIMRSLDINNAHCHDDISVRMVKICDDAIRSLYQSYIKIALKQVFILMHRKSLTLS